jgi:hypothetical protein
MMLSRKLPIRLLDFFVGRGFRDAERLVVILEFHRYLSVSSFQVTASLRLLFHAKAVPP